MLWPAEMVIRNRLRVVLIRPALLNRQSPPVVVVLVVGIIIYLRDILEWVGIRHNPSLAKWRNGSVEKYTELWLRHRNGGAGKKNGRKKDRLKQAESFFCYSSR